MPRLAIHMESFSSSNKVEASKPNNYNEIEAVKIGTLTSISPAERGPSAMLRDILTECRGTASEGPRNAGSFLKTSPPSLLGVLPHIVGEHSGSDQVPRSAGSPA